MRNAMLLASLLAGCVETGDGDPVTGTESDVRTAPGAYAGYRVVAPCQTPDIQLGVVGSGSTALASVNDIAAAGATLLARFTDLKSVWGGGGYGLVCDPGVGTELFVDNWRDVDTVIARTGQWLLGQNLSLEVGISVIGEPIPDLGG